MDDFFNELETNNKKMKCVNCGKEIEDIRNGCPHCDKDNTHTNYTNIQLPDFIAKTLKVIAWIILVLGFIMGFILGKDEFDSISIVPLLTIWGIFAGAFLGIYALGEIIQILHDIRSRLYTKV